MAEHKLTYSHKRPAAAAIAIVLASVSAPASAAADLTIGEFLKSISGSTDTKDLPPSNVARQYINANGIEESQYQIIVDDNYAPYDTYFAIKASYKTYCEAGGGKLDPTSSNNNGHISEYYSNELDQYDRPNISGYQLFTVVCRDQANKMWSAMAIVVADRVMLERSFEWSNVAPLELKTFSTTTTVIAVDPKIFSATMQQKMINWPSRKHKTAPSPVLSTFRDNQSSYLLRQKEFQANLAIGDQTNCGKVIEMRGSLIRIKLPDGVLFHSKPSAWINKDRLTNDPPVDCTNG